MSTPTETPRPVLCRGCSKDLIPSTVGLWEDTDGLVVCVKGGHGYQLGQPVDHYVYHHPMPDGLRGAPS